MTESIAFNDLTKYIEKRVTSGSTLFKLSEIHAHYKSRLCHMGIQKEVNKTRLKNRLLDHFPEAEERTDGKNTVLVFNGALRDILKDAVKERDYKEDAILLTKAAKMIRKDILDHPCFTFSGSFSHKCQEDSLPSSLVSLVSMILNGSNSEDQDRGASQACLTIGQCMVYNIKKRTGDSEVKTRHTLDREPPLPIYTGINIHTLTRSKTLIQHLYELGISVSYKRVMEIEEMLATSVCERFVKDELVCPPSLRKGLFTVGALDNIDHDPSSTTSKGSFRGTGISLFQFPTNTEPGESRPPIEVIPSDSRKHSLPDSYAYVPPVTLTTSNISVPECQIPMSSSDTSEARKVEANWIKQVLNLLHKEETSGEDPITWSAYHANRQPTTEDPPALTALFPLFYEKAATPAMIKHGLTVQKEAITYLNPGQIPVTTLDQSLFALAKYVQRKWPATHGEDVQVVMLGGLYIEMALWNTLGDLLEGSGWTTALTESEVATRGKANSYLKASHLTRTRHAHQVTLVTLYNIQNHAFMDMSDTGDRISNDAWLKNQKEKSPTFMYWNMIMKYETLILLFVRAHRENFSLYLEVLEELVFLFFALDHMNYARWLPVHIRDMKVLPESIKMEFEDKLHWVVPKTTRKFSAIPIDQAHEQENKVVKSAGGCIGLTENPVAFTRWMVSGPELSRLIQQFEQEYLPDENPDNPGNFKHHEQGLSSQKAIKVEVENLSKTITKMGNPFLTEFPELVTIDSHRCMDETVVESIRNLEDIGRKQYEDFVNDVLIERTLPIQTTIKKLSLPLFKNCQGKAISSHGQKVKELRDNVELFGQMYISMQSRDGDLDELFSHQIQSYPPSLSDYGKLHMPATKSQLLNCLECNTGDHEVPSTYDCKVMDGAVLVHYLPPNGANTFEEYANHVFIPYLERQLEGTSRLDIVWDTYIQGSLKTSALEKRGNGTRRKVSAQTKLPGDWNDFLRVDENKVELFDFLTAKVADFTFPSAKVVHITSRESVVSRGSSSEVPACNHEEADTRIVVHVMNALEQGQSVIQVRTADTDVAVIPVGVFSKMIETQPLVNISVAYRCYSINEMCVRLGEKYRMLYRYSMHSVDAMQLPPSREKENIPFGRHGRHVKK